MDSPARQQQHTLGVTFPLSVCLSPTWLLGYLLVVENHLNYKDQGVWVDGSYSLADFFVYLVFVAL